MYYTAHVRPKETRVFSPDPLAAALAPITTLVTDWALWMIPLVLLLVALRSLLLPKLRGVLGERRVGAVLERIGTECLHDVIFPDGRGGLTQVDHVVLTGAGLLVVETKNYRGSILGQEGEAHWTQRLGRQSFRFQNPVRQNSLHTQVVKALVPGVPVLGWVVFTDSARFPKGKPEGVSSLRDLRRELRDKLGDAPPSAALRAAWERLKGRADQRTEARKAHLDAIRERRGPDRGRRAAWVMLLLSALSLAALGLRPSNRVGPLVQAPPTVVANAPAVLVPHPAVVAHPPRQVAPVAPTSAPPLLEWANRRSGELKADRRDCNAAIAAVLADNSEQHRRRRDRACGKPTREPSSRAP